MDIQKEFDRWWNTFKNQATRQYPVKAAREAWVACAMLMADKVKELELTCGVRGYDGLLKQLKEYEQQAKDNEGKDNIIIADLQAQLSQAQSRIEECWNACATLMSDRVKELEAEKKALEKCYNIANDYTVELLKEIKHLQAEKKELKERCERYIWNLGGVSTLLLGYSIDEFNKEYALPALLDTNEFVKKHKDLKQVIQEVYELASCHSCNLECETYDDVRQIASKLKPYIEEK